MLARTVPLRAPSPLKMFPFAFGAAPEPAHAASHVLHTEPAARLAVLLSVAAGMLLLRMAWRKAAAMPRELLHAAAIGGGCALAAYAEAACAWAVSVAHSFSAALDSSPWGVVAAAVVAGFVAYVMPPAAGEAAWVRGHGWCTVRATRGLLARRVILLAARDRGDDLYVTERSPWTGRYAGPMINVDRAGAMAELYSAGRR